jgi:hypothetical protein
VVLEKEEANVLPVIGARRAEALPRAARGVREVAVEEVVVVAAAAAEAVVAN